MHRGGVRRPADLLALARQETDEDVRWELVSALHADASRECFDRAVALCDSGRASDRCLAADVLGQLGTPFMPWRDRSIEPLRALLKDGDVDVVRSAAVALGHLRAADAIDDLVALCEHAHPEVRHAAAFALMGHDEPRAVAALVALTRDESDLVRDWATFALSTQLDTDTPAVRDALAERLSDPDEATRAEALVGLASRGDPRAMAPLCEQLERADAPRVLVDAARTLASRDALPSLLSLRERGWAITAGDEELLDAAIAACRAGRGAPLP